MEYLKEKLTPSQTGFIPGMGIQVNLYRAIERIRLRTENKKTVFGLFIDFAHAYNTVLHSLLFQKLREKRRCLAAEETDYLEALYTHYRIRMGKRIIRYNKGLAQGSILSPALFNIYIEDLVDKISQDLGMNHEDILLYVDDILLLCHSPEYVRRCISLVESWCEQNGMKLNKHKSGIVVFSPRNAKNIPFMELKEVERDKKIVKEWMPSTKDIAGVPILSSYKYLRTRLEAKLSLKPQMNYIRDKSGKLFTKLYPYLVNALADGRRDMWVTMVTPLFDGVLALMHREKTVVHLENVIRLWAHTFKLFMMIPKSTNSELMGEMSGISLVDRIIYNAEEATIRWEARKERRKPEEEPVRYKFNNYLRGLSNDLCFVIKAQCRLCPKCKNTTMNAWHMKYIHDIELYPYKRLWRHIKDFYLMEEEKRQKKKSISKTKREVFIQSWNPVLLELKKDTLTKLENFFTK